MSSQDNSATVQKFLNALDLSITTGQSINHGGAPSGVVPAAQVAYQYLLHHAHIIDWTQYTPNVIDQGPSGRYGRVRLGIGELTGIELVLVRVPPNVGGCIHRHRHCGWAVVMVLEGIEENTLYKEENDTIKELGKQTCSTGEILALSEEILHEISSPNGSLSLHVYSEAQHETCGAETR